MKRGTKKDTLLNFDIGLGLGIYGVCALLLIFSLKHKDLIVIFPITSTTYLWTQIIARKYLNENINRYKIAGILLILMGVILIQI